MSTEVSAAVARWAKQRDGEPSESPPRYSWRNADAEVLANAYVALLAALEEPAEVAAAVDGLKSTWNRTSKIVDEKGTPKMEWINILAVIVDHYLFIRKSIS